MRLLVGDIDDLAVTPADLSDMAFEGSPESVTVSVDGGPAAKVTPVRAASLDRPSGSVETDGHYDLSKLLRAPCDATVTWDSGTAFLHVVAYHYCSIEDVLNYGNEKRQSPGERGRTAHEAFEARAVAEMVCDDLCGRTFRATRKVDPTYGIPGTTHQLDWPASRILTPGWTAVGDGMARKSIGCSRWRSADEGEIEYVSGTDAGTPMDVRRAVAKLAASYLTASKVPDRAVYESTETGMTRYTLASSESTGIPDVDAIFARHARKRMAVL